MGAGRLNSEKDNECSSNGARRVTIFPRRTRPLGKIWGTPQPLMGSGAPTVSSPPHDWGCETSGAQGNKLEDPTIGSNPMWRLFMSGRHQPLRCTIWTPEAESDRTFLATLPRSTVGAPAELSCYQTPCSHL